LWGRRTELVVDSEGDCDSAGECESSVVDLHGSQQHFQSESERVAGGKEREDERSNSLTSTTALRPLSS
jgi:hypothetical protein